MNYTKFMEALKGKQKKLDKNHNGELDAEDFKKLRKEENELEEATVKTQKYSWGTMKTVHHGSDFSIPLHPEHHQAIAKLKDEQEHKFKDETGRHWTARRKGEDVHFQGSNGGSSTKVPHAHMSEEVKDPTPVAPTLDRKYIKGTPENKAHKEKNKPINGHPTGKYNEEVELDESVFDNKDHAQSIADKLKKKHEDGNYSVVSDHGKHRVTHAYYSDSRVKKDISKLNEEVELDEDISKMSTDKLKKHWDTHKDQTGASPVFAAQLKKVAKELAKRKALNKEEVELEEKLNPSMGAGEYVKDFKKSDAPQFAGKSEKKKRNMAIAAYLQAKRAVKEEVEELDEKSEQARKNKIMKNVMDASRGAKFKAQSGTTVPDPEPQHKTAQAHNKAIGRAIRKMSNEAVSPVTVKVNHALEAPHEETWEDTGICPEHNKKDCHECGKAAMKENTGLKSYKEFMMMLEYESDKSGSYTHKGSYGSEYAKKEREKDEKGFDSENEPAKRGPKMGSKRGPKANLGSSKLHTK